MILLIQCFKAFNNALGWKDPDSRERDGRNKVGRAQPPLQPTTKNKTLMKNTNSTVTLSFSLSTCFGVMEI